MQTGLAFCIESIRHRGLGQRVFERFLEAVTTEFVRLNPDDIKFFNRPVSFSEGIPGKDPNDVHQAHALQFTARRRDTELKLAHTGYVRLGDGSCRYRIALDVRDGQHIGGTFPSAQLLFVSEAPNADPPLWRLSSNYEDDRDEPLSSDGLATRLHESALMPSEELEAFQQQLRSPLSEKSVFRRFGERHALVVAQALTRTFVEVGNR